MGSLAQTKPLKLYSHKSGPNPWKVAIILEELGIPYESEYLEIPETKVEPYVLINPNGKIPSLHDPNHDITLFESGAIVEYLLHQYDTEGKLAHDAPQDKWLARSWLHLQMSAHGPSCGYKIWLNRTYAAEELVAANEFFAKEIQRVVGVLDRQLQTRKGPYLLGAKVSYADLMFVPHYLMLHVFVPGYDPAPEHPNFAAWLEGLKARPSVQKIIATRAALAK